MAEIELNKLTNANVYISGNNFATKSFLGKAEEFGLPMLKYIFADHKGLGLAGIMELWTGGIDKMDGKVKWGSWYKDAFDRCSNPGKPAKIMVRGALMTHDSTGLKSTVPYVCYVTAAFKDVPMGNFKHNDNAEFEQNYNAYYIKLEVDGVEKLQVDVAANILKINGVDLLADFKLAIG